MFSNSHSSNSNLSIYAFPLPQTKAVKKGQNFRKRRSESHPFPVIRKRRAESHPFPVNNPNVYQPKRLCQYVELPPHFSPFQPKTTKKQRQLAKEFKAALSEPLFNKIIESLKSNQIFKSSIPKDATIDKKTNPKTADLSLLIKDIPLAKLVNDPFVTKMDNEIKKVADSTTVPELKFKSVLDKVIADLNECIQIEGFTNKWNFFGSSLYGLVSDSSDIDIYYEYVSDGSAEVPDQLPMEMKKRMHKSKKFFKVYYIRSARVPVLKAIHFETRKEIDISFSNELGVQNSLLTKFYLNLNPDLKYLTSYLKHILAKYHNSGTHKITTHILIWLVCFFMQQKKLLPAVKDVRKSAKTKTEARGWDCSLPDVYPCKVEPVPLYSLVLEFFIFYKDFDFLNYVISPFLGRAVLFSDFERGLVATDELAVYFTKVQNGDQCTFSRSTMNVQDPTDLSLNLTRQVLLWNANKFRIICHSFSRLLPDNVAELGKIESLSQIFPQGIPFEKYNPYDLTQFAAFQVHNKSLETIFDKVNHNYVLETVRKVMEFVFELDKKRIEIAENVTQVGFFNEKTIQNAMTVLHLEYCSSERTWDNEFIKELFPGSEDKKEQFEVYLTCEVCVGRKLIRMFVQGESNFVKFLREQGYKLFAIGLTEALTEVVLA